MAEAEVVNEQEQEQEQPQEKKPEVHKPTRADYERLQAERARQNGWKDFDEYVEAGGDPEKWKTADAFNTYGELIGTVKRQKVEFEQRLEGQQTMTQALLAAQREELLAERAELIEQGGKGKEVAALDRQLDKLNQPVIPQTNADLDKWNAENQWIYEDSPKSAYARDQFNKAIASGKSVPDAISVVEAGIKKHYPPAARTATIPETERGGGPKGFGKNQQKAPTMDSLTAEERNIWKHSASMWGNDQKAFLQSVADTRKSAQGGK